MVLHDQVHSKSGGIMFAIEWYIRDIFSERFVFVKWLLRQWLLHWYYNIRHHVVSLIMQSFIWCTHKINSLFILKFSLPCLPQIFKLYCLTSQRQREENDCSLWSGGYGSYVTLYHKPLVKSAKQFWDTCQNVIANVHEMYTLWKIQTTITLFHDTLWS